MDQQVRALDINNDAIEKKKKTTDHHISSTYKNLFIEAHKKKKQRDEMKVQY